MTDSVTGLDFGLIDLFGRQGYRRIETAILQPADLFIDLSGEDLRRRMFVVQGADGAELCLRPEHTIPVCRAFIAAGATAPADYCYLGPVFRQRPGESGEFIQAGAESIGRRDIAAADAEIMALGLQGLALCGAAPSLVRFGDMGLLLALLDALAVTPAMKRRVTRALASGRGLADLVDAAAPAAPERHAGLLAAIEGQDRQAARAFVEDVISIAGIATIGGRSAGEIAERFLSRAANPNGALPSETRNILRRYLAIAADPDGAVAMLRDLAKDARLGIDAALDLFEERNGFMAARGLGLHSFRFAADFARNLDYYTGFIFEIQSAPRAGSRPVVAGGRYDRLIAHLGAGEPVPAVGCSFWLDRLTGTPASGAAP